MCNCGGGKRTTVKSLMNVAGQAPASPFPNEETESVVVVNPRGGFYTADSGYRYKSYGAGTKWVIRVADRPSLEKMGLITPKG